jgi:hypothetical protein
MQLRLAACFPSRLDYGLHIRFNTTLWSQLLGRLQPLVVVVMVVLTHVWQRRYAQLVLTVN